MVKASMLMQVHPSTAFFNDRAATGDSTLKARTNTGDKILSPSGIRHLQRLKPVLIKMQLQISNEINKMKNETCK